MTHEPTERERERARLLRQAAIALNDQWLMDRADEIECGETPNWGAKS